MAKLTPSSPPSFNRIFKSCCKLVLYFQILLKEKRNFNSVFYFLTLQMLQNMIFYTFLKKRKILKLKKNLELKNAKFAYFVSFVFAKKTASLLKLCQK